MPCRKWRFALAAASVTVTGCGGEEPRETARGEATFDSDTFEGRTS